MFLLYVGADDEKKNERKTEEEIECEERVKLKGERGKVRGEGRGNELNGRKKVVEKGGGKNRMNQKGMM